MTWIQTLSLVVGFPVLAISLHEITHLAVARLACPVSIEHASWIPFRVRLDFDRLPSTATLRLIALAPLLVGGVAAGIAVHTGVWTQLKAADPYYLHFLAAAYWTLYILPSPADLRLALWPPTDRMADVQLNAQ